ncbi:MAG: hypothetical protein ACOC3T_01240, partial [Bacteroidota bacterium]
MRRDFYRNLRRIKLPFSVFLLVFFLNFSFLPFAYSETDDSVIPGGYSEDEIKRGQRFFMGLLPFEREHEACVSCH